MKSSIGARLRRGMLACLASFPLTQGVAAPAPSATLVLTRSGCGKEPVAQNMAAVHSRWSDPNHLQVDFWEWETASDRVDGSHFGVSLADGVLRLRHRTRHVEMDANALAPACVYPVHLSYSVTGLEAGRYRLDVGATHAVSMSPAP